MRPTTWFRKDVHLGLMVCPSCFFLELQKKGKSEDKNAVLSVNKSKAQSSSLEQSGKQDLAKKPSSSAEQGNREIEHDKNNSKCVKTETIHSAAEGNDVQETSEEQESVNEATDVPVQKKRKRCWTCNAKLELAQRELGNCRCSKY